MKLSCCGPRRDAGPGVTGVGRTGTNRMSDTQTNAGTGGLKHMAWIADARHDTTEFTAGDTIFSEGDSADHMYVVRSGEVEIVVNGTVVDTVGPAGIFGEMALIDRAPRSATVRCKTDCSVLQLDERRFLFFVDETPFFALDVMRILVQRLRAMDAAI